MENIKSADNRNMRGNTTLVMAKKNGLFIRKFSSEKYDENKYLMARHIMKIRNK